MKDDIITKICTVCEKDKLLDEFYKNPRNKISGRHAQCKQCAREYNALHSDRNKKRTRKWDEDNAERKAEYVEAHREEQRIKARVRYWGNHEHVRLKAKEWRLANPELHQARAREYRKSHRNHIKEKARERYHIKKQDPVWYAAHIEKNRKWRDENREHYNAYYREYYRTHKGEKEDV